jgi:NLR family CARD domain-containing protein 3
MADSTDYWTDLVRVNLTNLTSIARSDGEEAARQPIDEKILDAPRRKSAKDEQAHQIAHRLYPGFAADSLAPVIKYEKDIVTLRAMVMQQRRDAIERASDRNASFDWVRRITKQGRPDAKALSSDGAPSLPMPVEVSDKVSCNFRCYSRA